MFVWLDVYNVYWPNATSFLSFHFSMSVNKFYFHFDFLLTFTCENMCYLSCWLLPLNIMPLSSSCLSQVTISFILSLFNILVVFVYVSHSFFYLMIKSSWADSVCITTINRLSVWYDITWSKFWRHSMGWGGKSGPTWARILLRILMTAFTLSFLYLVR